jgi:hypothetical protein
MRGDFQEEQKKRRRAAALAKGGVAAGAPGSRVDLIGYVDGLAHGGGAGATHVEGSSSSSSSSGSNGAAEAAWAAWVGGFLSPRAHGKGRHVEQVRVRGLSIPGRPPPLAYPRVRFPALMGLVA